jgi:putative membrane protein
LHRAGAVIVARKLPWRRILGDIGRPFLAYLVWAALVSVAHVAGAEWLAFPALPISVVAATLGILLSFRNNSAYDRWWEARTLWGGVVNQSRTFARQLLTFLPAAERPADDGGPEAGPERRSGGSVVVRTPLLETALATPGGHARRADRRRPTDGAVRTADGHADATPEPDGLPWERAAAGGDPQLAAFRRAAAELTARSAIADAGADPDEDSDPDADGAEGPRPCEPCHFEHVSPEARELVYAQIGFVNAMRCHLRRQDPLPAVAPFLRAAVVEALRDEQNVPAAILAWMATRLRRLFDDRRGGDAFRLVALDATLGELTNLLGACERIKNTPIPRQYDSLPRVMVGAYLLILPVGLVADLGLATPGITAVIAALFIALDQIGRNVEAPFENDVHDTPMTALCRTIEINLRQMLGETELPPPVQPAAGFLL